MCNQGTRRIKAEYLLCGSCLQPKKQLKVQVIGILEDLDSFNWPKVHLWKVEKEFRQGLPPLLDKIQKNNYFFFLKPSLTYILNCYLLGLLVFAKRIRTGPNLSVEVDLFTAWTVISRASWYSQHSNRIYRNAQKKCRGSSPQSIGNLWLGFKKAGLPILCHCYQLFASTWTIFWLPVKQVWSSNPKS